MLKNRAGDNLLVQSTLFSGTKVLIDCISDVTQPALLLLDNNTTIRYSNLKFINIDYGTIINPRGLFYQWDKKIIPFVCTNHAPLYVRMIGEQSWYADINNVRWVTDYVSIDIGGEELIIL